MHKYLPNINNFLDEFGCDWLCPSYPLDKKDEFELIRGWNETKWIVVSSTFFSIPAIWSIQTIHNTYYPEHFTIYHPYVHDNLRFSYMLIATSLVSMNYWRNAKRGWRRNADLLFAKITFITGTYTAFKYTKNINAKITYLLFIYIIYICYQYSTKYVNLNDKKWIRYHFLFHTCLSITGGIILYDIQSQLQDLQ